MIDNGLANPVDIYLIRKRTNIIKRKKDRFLTECFLFKNKIAKVGKQFILLNFIVAASEQ